MSSSESTVFTGLIVQILLGIFSRGFSCFNNFSPPSPFFIWIYNLMGHPRPPPSYVYLLKRPKVVKQKARLIFKLSVWSSSFSTFYLFISLPPARPSRFYINVFGWSHVYIMQTLENKTNPRIIRPILRSSPILTILPNFKSLINPSPTYVILANPNQF